MHTTRENFSTVEEAIDAIRRGRIVIVMDSEDRENEGDFTAAAEKVTAEMIHFMATHGRGQLCMPIPSQTAERLDLRPMVSEQGINEPRFAVPVDHRACTSGISPAERALTITEIIAEGSRATDFIRPGHVFPLIAQGDGVLRRPGHTEAAIDLTRLAGLTPAGLLCEICSRDGRNMARGTELVRIAERYRMPIVTIDNLIAYRHALAEDADLECSVLESTQFLSSSPAPLRPICRTEAV